jgi:phosphatidylglycerol:prolipoprotein diacylglycerol transferase
MFPVIASIEGLTISSFGLFLMLAFLTGFFVVWRIIRLYDIDPEKIIDLSLLIFLGSIIGARLFFVVTHFPQFNNLFRVIDLLKNPGLSFWGGFFGGALMVIFFSKRLKLRLWQAADLIMVGFFIALAVGGIGCLLGSCEYGVPSQLPFAVTQIGVLEKRFPVQILQSLLSLAAFWYLWKSIIRFHFDGQITGIGLILLAVIKLITEPLKTPQVAIRDISITYFLCLILLISGIWLLYNRSKKSLKQDLAYSVNVISQQNKRKQALSSAKKWWYNLYVNSLHSAGKLKRSLFKLLHVKPNPSKF